MPLSKILDWAKTRLRAPLLQVDSSFRWWIRRETNTLFALLARSDLRLEHLISEQVNPTEAGWFYQRQARWEPKTPVCALH
jgi:hypothetical protein